MLNLIYSSALTTLFLGLAVLIMYEKDHLINSLARGGIVLASLAYTISIALFSESISFKCNILLRDISLIFCVLISFRIIRNSKVLFSLLMGGLIFGMTNFGFNHIHDSFKISKFSVLKEASASTNAIKAKRENTRETAELKVKSSKN